MNSKRSWITIGDVFDKFVKKVRDEESSSIMSLEYFEKGDDTLD